MRPVSFLLAVVPCLAFDWPSDIEPYLDQLEPQMPLTAKAKVNLISRRCASGSNTTTCCQEYHPYLNFLSKWKDAFSEGFDNFFENTRRDELTGQTISEFTGYHVGGLDPEGREDAFRIRVYWDRPDAQSHVQVTGADVVNVRCQWVRKPISCDQC